MISGEDNTDINSFACRYLGTSIHIYWKFIQYFRRNAYRKVVENFWVVPADVFWRIWLRIMGPEWLHWNLALSSYHRTIPRTDLNPTKFSVWISPALGWLQASTPVSLECYTALIGSKLPTFRDNLCIPSSRVKQSTYPATTSTSVFNSFDHIDLLSFEEKSKIINCLCHVVFL